MIGNLFGNMFKKDKRKKNHYSQQKRHDSENCSIGYRFNYEEEQKVRNNQIEYYNTNGQIKQVKTHNKKQTKKQNKFQLIDNLDRHFSCPDTQQQFGQYNNVQKIENNDENVQKQNIQKQYLKQQSFKPNQTKEDEEFKGEVKMSKEDIKRKRRLMRDKKDVKVRREWGSQSGELLVINEDYIPIPEYNEFSSQEEKSSKKSSSYSMSPNQMQRQGILSSQDFMRKCSDTSSTSDSDINSQEDKPHGYEKLMKNIEKKKGKISKTDFSIISLIGTGSYGKVFLVRKIDTGKIYAMKVLTKSFVRKYKQIKHTWTERKVLEKVIHPFIVKLKYAFQSPKKLFLVMEYCPGGELFFYLSKIGRFKQRSAQFYAANILLALEFLHKKGVIYRDLKPENVLIAADGYAKITDFGLSKDDMNEGRQTKSICGTTEYLSPEMLLGKGYDSSCDWWGYGCLVYEMLVGLPPFYFKSQDELFNAILHLPPQYPEFLSPQAKDLISQLLDKNPQNRLKNPKQIKNHPFFADIDWKKMKQKKIKPPYTPSLKGDEDITHFDTNDLDLTINTPADLLNETIEKNGVIGTDDINNHDFDGFTFDGNSTMIMNILESNN